MADYHGRLSPSQEMHSQDRLFSWDGNYVFKLQYDGNLVLYPSSSEGNRHTAMWSSGTVNTFGPTFVCIMQDDGNLVLYGERLNDQPGPGYGNVYNGPQSFGRGSYWPSGTAGNSGAYLDMQADGNLVIYTADRRAIWATGTSTDE